MSGSSLILSLPAESLQSSQLTTCALDIGGSLAKLAHVSENLTSSAGRYRREIDSTDVHVTLKIFPIDNLDCCLKYIKEFVVGKAKKCRATGVGALKYGDLLQSELNEQLELQIDSQEIEHAALGIVILSKFLHPNSHIDHTELEAPPLNFDLQMESTDFAPCLLVNVGSAMTIAKLLGDGSVSNIVGGSAQGGLTFIGLGSLLTGVKDFTELIKLAEEGNHESVDLLVKDTAGQSYNQISANSMVSSFGKAAYSKFNGTTFSTEDLACSLLNMMTDIIVQNVFLVAKCEQVHAAYFCGSYLSESEFLRFQVSKKLKQVSMFLQYMVKPVYIPHGTYVGAIGAMFSSNSQELNRKL